MQEAGHLPAVLNLLVMHIGVPTSTAKTPNLSERTSDRHASFPTHVSEQSHLKGLYGHHGCKNDLLGHQSGNRRHVSARLGYRMTYTCRLQDGGAQTPHLPTYARLRRDARKRAEIDAVAAVDPASSGLAKQTAERIFAPTMTKFLSAGYTRRASAVSTSEPSAILASPCKRRVD